MALLRLHKKSDIETVMKRGRSVRDPHCGLRFLKNDLGAVRIAFVIGTKTDKRAVVRNRLRRQYREVANTLLGATATGVDIVFFPTLKSLELSYEERLANLQKLLQANKIIA